MKPIATVPLPAAEPMDDATRLRHATEFAERMARPS